MRFHASFKSWLKSTFSSVLVYPRKWWGHTSCFWDTTEPLSTKVWSQSFHLRVKVFRKLSVSERWALVAESQKSHRLLKTFDSNLKELLMRKNLSYLDIKLASPNFCIKKHESKAEKGCLWWGGPHWRPYECVLQNQIRYIVPSTLYIFYI